MDLYYVHQGLFFYIKTWLIYKIYRVPEKKPK